jgi:FkbM family methyltransferase
MHRLTTLRQLVALLGVMQTIRILLRRLLGAVTVTVHFPGTAGPLTTRFNNSDLVLLLGVFLHGDCRVALQPAPALILDLGANTGLTARAWADQFPSARIVAVEPDADTCLLCAQNTATHAGTICLNRIIGPAAGHGVLANPAAISMARQFTPLPAGSTGGIRISPIEELLDEYPSPGPVLVKMDIEGAEIPLFKRAGLWLGRVQGVLVEPHGEGTAELIGHTLTREGFKLLTVGEKILGLRPPWATLRQNPPPTP